MTDLLIHPPILVPRANAPAPPTTEGRLKTEPEDFIVEEVPAYIPSGEGDFTYLWVEKRDIAAPAFARLLGKRLEVSPRDLGIAGRKDRRAITRQWVSVLARDIGDPKVIEGPFGDGGMVRLLDVQRHQNKLRTGHLRGNRFAIRVHGLTPAEAEHAALRLNAMASEGFIDTYGAQRFSGGESVAAGLNLMRGGKIRDRGARRFAISAVQSAVFNHWAARRVADGLETTALLGDVLSKRETGGVFVCEDPDTDTARIAAGELVVTGPMMGSKYRAATEASGARDLALLRDLGVPDDAFEGLGKLGRGTRRALIVWPEEVQAEVEEDHLSVRFSLPAGSYATTFLALACGPSVTERPPRPAAP